MNRISYLKSLLVLGALALSAIGGVSAQDEKPADDMRIRFYGNVYTDSELNNVRSGLVYCGQVITEDVAKRGYWDSRYDEAICFNSQEELDQQSNANMEWHERT